MSCYFPLEATQLPGGEIIVHKRHLPRKPTPAHLGRDIKLPCGKCIGCKIEHGRNWAVRCLHESQLHQHNCALTLTYSDDSNYEAVTSEDRHYPHQDMWIGRKSARELPTAAQEGFKGPNTASVDNSRSNIRREVTTLSLRDHQLFMKKFRKEVGEVRFFMCGEYGDKLLRPHYHYLIFGYDFPDKYYFKKSLAGTRLYRSPTLEKLWTFGHAWIGDVDFNTCAYVSSYITKKITGDKADWHYRRTDEAGNDFYVLPEFSQMSRRPGIAAEWWNKYSADVTVDDAVVLNGMKLKPPRYYDKLLERTNPIRFEQHKTERVKKALLHTEDNTPARLLDREKVATARHNMKKRQLEKSR